MSGKKKTLRIPPQLDHLYPLLSFVLEFAAQLPFSRHDLKHIELAVEEAFVNILRHCKPIKEVIVFFEAGDEKLIIIMEHEGEEWNPLEIIHELDIKAPLEQRPSGGWGLLLMSKCVDTLEFVHTPHEKKSKLHLHKKYAKKSEQKD